MNTTPGPNTAVAERARQIARTAASRNERAAALTVAVATGTTSTIAAAREALAELQPGPIRDDATALLDQLATETSTTTEPEGP